MLIALVLVFLYPYLIYPAVLWVVVRMRRDAGQKPGGSAEALAPLVALVICALNEEQAIAEKLVNCRALDYPRDRLQIVVVSDGSTDRTAEVARRFAGDEVEVIEQPVRRGKIANLNEVLPQCAEEILVLSDANVMYRPDALRKLVARFQDPDIGCVSGKVMLTDSTAALDKPTENYYSLEWFLQAGASSIYSMVGADGAMYALRRKLFRPCPADTLIEDLVIPMAVIRQGKRVVHEPAAVGWERGPSSLREEFRRKVRIAAGAAQGLLRGNAWPPPSASLSFWFVFVSHKLLRWISPVVGAAIVICAALCSDRASARVVLAGLGASCTLAALQLVWRSGNRLLSVPFYFLFGQAAVGLGLVRGITGRQSVLWAKQDR
ncbi:MAG TPA: glycosyltransferase family 2 protein [Bryobacteraceae bacterium]|jgi:cellulose synthase/poly-beta-1,6-N-acetylglucosamine synthase-like glycosyltransferase